MPADEIDREVAEPKTGRSPWLCRRCRRAVRMPRHQLVHAERLRDEVVGAEIERLDLAGLVAAARKDDDRDGRTWRAQLAQQVQPGHVGQAEVEDDQIRRFGQ